MPQLLVSDVKVTKRFRNKFVDIDKLANSIRDFGLIHPIVIDENNSLIAGERRLKAHKKLKMEYIEVRYIKDLEDIQKKEIELEENIQRSAFTWQEEVSAKAQLHKLKQKIYGKAIKGHETKDTWGIRDTADALGESLGSTSMDIALAEGMKLFPELMQEKTKTTAFKKLKQKREAILQTELAKRLKERGFIGNPNVIQGNCVEEMGKMEAGSIDLIIADPPFGIDFDKAESTSKTHASVYPISDDEFTIMDLMDRAFAQMFRVLKDNRHAYIFYGCQHYDKILTLLRKHGFEVHDRPNIWDKLSGGFPSQSVNFTSSYEPFFFCTKGRRKLNGTPRDVFPIKRVPPQYKIHPTEKPTELLRTLVKLSSLPGEKVLDPFAGSGSTLVAAKELNRVGVGIELDIKYHANIVARLKEEGDDE